ncbi:MAG: TolC family protein [Sphingomonadales bacterium]|nr:TolC family protein [Sphingomonadales bacterium]
MLLALLLAAIPAQGLRAATPAPDQTLDATIAAALAHAPALAEARAHEAEARARLAEARAEGNPSLSADGSYGAGRIDNGGFFGFTAAATTPLSLRAGAELPLYAGGRTATAISGARSGVTAAGDQTAQTRLAVVVEAVSTYVEVISARRLDARYRRLVDELAEVERQADLRFRTGEIPASDLATARARHAEGLAGLAQASGRLASAEAHFARLTGAVPAALAPLPPPPLVPASLDEASARAMAANPALKAAMAAGDAARANGRAARAESLPTVGAFAEATRMRDEFFPGYRADAVTVGVRGHWTLWAGGRTAAKIHEADAAEDASEARTRAVREALQGEIIDAWSAIHTAAALASASDQRLLAATEALRSTRLEARVGAAPTLAVLDAEREAIAAEAAAIDAAGQRLVAAWKLDALIGDDLP